MAYPLQTLAGSVQIDKELVILAGLLGRQVIGLSRSRSISPLGKWGKQFSLELLKQLNDINELGKVGKLVNSLPEHLNTFKLLGKFGKLTNLLLTQCNSVKPLGKVGKALNSLE